MRSADCGGADDGIRIVSWNIRNHLSMNRVVDGRWRPDYPKPAAEATAVLAVLQAIAADLVLLQESGGAGHVLELRRDLRALGIEYPLTGWLNAADPARRLALLGADAAWSVHGLPWFVAVGGAADKPAGRGVLAVTLGRGACRWLVATVHWKSPYTVDPQDPGAQAWRCAEARQTVDWLGRQCAQPGLCGILLLGDFNEPPAGPARTLLQAGGWRPVPALDGDGEAWTFHYSRDASRSAIDGAYWLPVGTCRAAVPHARIIGGTEVKAASDHRPLVVEIRPASSR